MEHRARVGVEYHVLTGVWPASGNQGDRRAALSVGGVRVGQIYLRTVDKEVHLRVELGLEVLALEPPPPALDVVDRAPRVSLARAEHHVVHLPPHAIGAANILWLVMPVLEQQVDAVHRGPRPWDANPAQIGRQKRVVEPGRGHRQGLGGSECRLQHADWQASGAVALTSSWRPGRRRSRTTGQRSRPSQILRTSSRAEAR